MTWASQKLNYRLVSSYLLGESNKCGESWGSVDMIGPFTPHKEPLKPEDWDRGPGKVTTIINAILAEIQLSAEAYEARRLSKKVCHLAKLEIHQNIA